MNLSLEMLVDWKNYLFFPYARRKDAGYIASVLADYGRFSDIDKQRLGGRRVEVDSYANALRLGDENNATRWIALVTYLRAVGAAPPQAMVIDALGRRIWLQGYMVQLFVVEKAVLQLHSPIELVARAPFLVERYRIVSDNQADRIVAQYSADLSAEKLNDLRNLFLDPTQQARAAQLEADLRAKLLLLLNDIQWFYAQSQVREELFLAQQLALIGSFIVFAGLLWLGVTALADSCTDDKTVVWVMFLGMLGAFTSVMRRMRADVVQHGGGTESSVKELTALAYGKIGVVFGLVFGGVFAWVLMRIFEANILDSVLHTNITSTLLPKFSPDNTVVTEGAKCTCSGPLCNLSIPNLARLYVWSFLAGFAEQLVPDVLDRLTKAAEPKAPQK